MDQKKNAQGEQGQRQQNSGQQNPQRQGQQQNSPDNFGGSRNRNTESQPTRDQAEGSRDKSRTNMGNEQRGVGREGEKNRSGISNRGMSSSEEQSNLPSRGSTDDESSEQSER